MAKNIGFGKGDDAIRNGGDLDFYRGKEGKKDRIAICWFFKDEDGSYQMSEDDTPQFLTEEIHYVEGKGYVLDNDYLRDKKGPPKRKVGTFIVHYQTDKRGQIDKENFDYSVKPWTFGEDKFRDLAELHENFPLTQHDLKVICKGEQFQKLTFQPIPKKALWQQNDKFRERVLETVTSIQDRLSIGREVPLEELKDHFGDSVSPAPDPSSDTDFDDLIDGIE